MRLFWNKKKNEPKIGYAEVRAKVEEILIDLKKKEGHDNLYIEYDGIKDGNYKFNVVSYEEEMEDELHSLESLLKMPITKTEGMRYSDVFKSDVGEILVLKSYNNKKIGSIDADKLVGNMLSKLDVETEVIDFEDIENEFYKYLIAATGKAKIQDRSRSIPNAVRDAVWNRDNGCCIRCGSNIDIEFDHIIPFSKGGTNTYRNIQILCQRCNRVKSNKIG